MNNGRRFSEKTMKKKLCFISIFILITSTGFGIPLAHSQTEYHGADSVFEKDGIVILWAILKGQDETSSWVYTKIIKSEDNPYHFFSVEAIDPFSKEKEWVVKGMGLEKVNVVKSVRTSFRDKTSRRFLFFRNAEALEKETPDMTVFYMGVPDTAPEVLSEKEMDSYFEKALGRVRR